MIKFYDSEEDFKTNHLMCNAWVATAVVGSAVIGAGAQMYGANKAADAQGKAAQMGIDANMQMYNTTRNDLAPYREIGQRASTDLTGRLDELTAPIELTQDWLENTPGYQFTRQQGLKVTQNAAAARGLGVSGAALKGAATFATGLADNTYKTQFDVARANKSDAYSRLKGLVDTGQSAAAATGAAGTSTAKTVGDLGVGAGNAEAAMWNAGGGAVKNFANDVGGYAAYKGLYGGGNPSSDAFGSNPFTPSGSINPAYA